MRTFEGIADAANQLNAYFYANRGSIPGELADRIEPLLGPTRSPVDAVVKVSELVFANKEVPGIPDELKELAASSALLAEAHGFHAMDEGSRGTKIAGAILRESGIRAKPGHPWPKAENDPEVKDEYRLTQPEPAAPAEPPAEG